MGYEINLALLEQFREKMQKEERSRATIEKYLRDIRTFIGFVGKDTIFHKETVIAYKQYLMEKYAPASVNSMLAAVNSFFKENGWYDCVVKAVKIQKEAFRSGKKELTREEYYRLLQTAKRKENRRLYMLMQTIATFQVMMQAY